MIGSDRAHDDTFYPEQEELIEYHSFSTFINTATLFLPLYCHVRLDLIGKRFANENTENSK